MTPLDVRLQETKTDSRTEAGAAAARDRGHVAEEKAPAAMPPCWCRLPTEAFVIPMSNNR